MKNLSILILLITAIGISHSVSAQDTDAIFNTNFSNRSLSERWELDRNSRKGTFLLTPYKPSYLTPLRWSSSPNDLPLNTNFRNGIPPQKNWSSFETKFQLSFKTKIIQDVLFGVGDIWFTFTQKAFWQVFAASQSRPFRELNYEPEIIYNIPINWAMKSFNLRMISIGVNHQSNGREAALSRSWNRIIFQLGMTYRHFTLIVRPWIRIPENRLYDDNFDIEHYLGNGDATLIYTREGLTFSLLMRNNFKLSDNKGFVEFSLAFPFDGNLKILLQSSYGYGDSLIDYNHKQGYIGIGFSLTEWL